MDGEWWRALEAPVVRWIIIALVVMAFVAFSVAPDVPRRRLTGDISQRDLDPRP